MSYSASNFRDVLDEFEEERIIRQYEEECANEEVLDIKKLNLNGSVGPLNEKSHKGLNKCLDISDNEYLENLSVLDNDSDRSSSTGRKPLFINTSIPQFALDNLNQIAALHMKHRNCFKELENYRELNSSNSTINSSQLNDEPLMNGHDRNDSQADRPATNRSGNLTKSTHSNSLDQLNHNGDTPNDGPLSAVYSSTNNLSGSNPLENGLSGNHLSENNRNNLSTNSSNDNLLQNGDSLATRRSTLQDLPIAHARRRRRNHSIVTFELISARSTLATDHLGSSSSSNSSFVSNSTSNKRFVLYTIIIKRAPGLETEPGIIEKRYSEFYMFFLSLRKAFPLFFNEFPFPKKIYSNNFEADVIAERSIVFQHLLTFMLSVRELRNSAIFHGFLLNGEFKKCRRLLRNSAFEEAIICLENLLFILTKLNRVESSRYLQLNIFTTYLALSACTNEIEHFSDAAHWADEAFKMISFSDAFDNNDLIIPFLLLSVQVNSRLSRCCKAQNQKLLELCSNGVTYDKKESLAELFVLKNYFVQTP